MPAEGYDSVNLPSELYKWVKRLIEEKRHLGYRSIAEFVAEAVRRRVEEVERHYPLTSEDKAEVRARGKKS